MKILKRDLKKYLEHYSLLLEKAFDESWADSDNTLITSRQEEIKKLLNEFIDDEDSFKVLDL